MGANGMVASPHYLASIAGLEILQEGGSAVDATIAVNSTLGVVYPHMTGMGGDAFWLIHDARSGAVHALNGSGRTAAAACRDLYRNLGHRVIPIRGPLAAITMPGAVDSWCKAHERFGRLPLTRVLEPAIRYAREGYPVSPGQARFTEATAEVLMQHPETQRTFMPDNRAPRAGEVMQNRNLADTMELVARHGRAGFYEGKVRDEMVRAVRESGGCWQPEDLSKHHGTWEKPISTTYRQDYTCYQHPPNCQGFVHLMMLNILEQFDLAGIGDGHPDYVHLAAEATKLAFIDRDRYLTDPDICDVPIPLDRLLSKEYAAELARSIDLTRARSTDPQPVGQHTTCTVAVDGDGNAVSMIQSIYHEFGSGVVAGSTGVLLQNRGSFFSLLDDHVNRLEPGKRCFHTLMPGMLFRDDKPFLVYGTMGGEGQPQTSTALVTRVVDFGQDVQTAIDQPRWLYGRTWGEESRSLRVESRIGEAEAADLKARGHDVQVVGPWSDVMGHAAAIQIDQSTGVLHGAADARGDGIAVGW
jgi:gamma-glutamyltranspeptidase/glutathione hydrolase